LPPFPYSLPRKKGGVYIASCILLKDKNQKKPRRSNCQSIRFVFLCFLLRFLFVCLFFFLMFLFFDCGFLLFLHSALWVHCNPQGTNFWQILTLGFVLFFLFNKLYELYIFWSITKGQNKHLQKTKHTLSTNNLVSPTFSSKHFMNEQHSTPKTHIHPETQCVLYCTHVLFKSPHHTTPKKKHVCPLKFLVN